MKYFELQMGGFSATLIISGHGSMKGKIYTRDHMGFLWTVFCQMYHKKTVTLHLTNINLSCIHNNSHTIISDRSNKRGDWSPQRWNICWWSNEKCIQLNMCCYFLFGASAQPYDPNPHPERNTDNFDFKTISNHYWNIFKYHKSKPQKSNFSEDKRVMVGLGALPHLIITVAAQQRRAVGDVYWKKKTTLFQSWKRASIFPSRWNSDGVWSLTQARG